MNSTPSSIISATPTGKYRSRLVLDDNAVQEVEFKPKFARPHHSGNRVYPKPDRFAGFSVEQGEWVWGDNELCFPIINLYRNTIEHDQSMTVAA